MPSEIEAQDVVVMKAATAKDRVFDPLAVKYVVWRFQCSCFTTPSGYVLVGCCTP
jgi:hypothetical protein